MNTIAYIIYLSITSWITVYIGGKLHKHGYWYIIDLFAGNTPIATSVNHLLLVGYYLLNLGYVAVTIAAWSTIYTYVQLLEVIIHKIGFIVLGLAIIHYINMAALIIFSKMQKQKTKNNTM